MEEDLVHYDESKEMTDAVRERLDRAVDAAQERIDYEAAHNPELLRALGIVNKFLKKHGRVCYGGTAMNAILPPKKRFYDPETDLPDYDFFTPDMDGDIEKLVKEFKAAGFVDVYHRVGIHEGTKKILVNFVAIADISALSPEIYNAFHKRAIVKGGIYYTDPDVLRMMMYLELSRPKGQVERWEKVYERLHLINSVFPPKAGGIRGRGTRRGKAQRGPIVKSEVREILLNYCVEQQRILISGPLEKFYRDVVNRKNVKFDLEEHRGPIVFISPSVHDDSIAILKALGGPAVAKSFLHRAKGEIVPEHIEVRYRGDPVAIIFQEVACHSYLNFPLNDGRSIAIASLDTLITTYLAIALFTVRARERIPGIDAAIPKFIELTERNRTQKDPHIPAFPITCRGYQKGYSTLLREKFLRTQKEKEKQKEQ